MIWKISFIQHFELNVDSCSSRKEEINFCWAEAQESSVLFWDGMSYTRCKLALFEVNGNIPI